MNGRNMLWELWLQAHHVTKSSSPSNQSNPFNQPFLEESAGNVSEAYNVLVAISNTPALHEEAVTRPLNANRES